MVIVSGLRRSLFGMDQRAKIYANAETDLIRMAHSENISIIDYNYSNGFKLFVLFVW